MLMYECNFMIAYVPHFEQSLLTKPHSSKIVSHFNKKMIKIKLAVALLTQLLFVLHPFCLFREAITASLMRKYDMKLLVTYSFYVAKCILQVLQFFQPVHENLKNIHMRCHMELFSVTSILEELV